MRIIRATLNITQGETLPKNLQLQVPMPDANVFKVSAAGVWVHKNWAVGDDNSVTVGAINQHDVDPSMVSLRNNLQSNTELPEDWYSNARNSVIFPVLFRVSAGVLTETIEIYNQHSLGVLPTDEAFFDENFYLHVAGHTDDLVAPPVAQTNLIFSVWVRGDVIPITPKISEQMRLQGCNC